MKAEQNASIRLQDTELHLMKMLRLAKGYAALVRGQTGSVPFQMEADITAADQFINHGSNR